MKKPLERYVAPHRKKGREVKIADLKRVRDEAVIMLELCKTPRGLHPGAYAIAHTQIEAKDPLAFFVLNTGMIVMNPVITRMTKFKVDSKEGCMSFPDNEPLIVPRSNKCDVSCSLFRGIDKPFQVDELNCSGKDAFIFQHEIDHLNGLSIYDKIGGDMNGN